MKERTINGNKYKLPRKLNAFQLDMYVHLIDWKWANITKQPGRHGAFEYDAILPDSFKAKHPMLYSAILKPFKQHRKRFDFKLHNHYNHMSSSQMASANLFLPILLNQKAESVLKRINPDIAQIARNELDNGYRIEYWDEPFGNLNDHNARSGTDSDIGIAYYNKEKELCLWLIEHKLTENKFTKCGGYRSKGRKQQHECTKTFSQILNNKDVCYLHQKRKYKCWQITDANRGFFVNHAQYSDCPFKDDKNQLWRNQLLAMSVEQDTRLPYKHASFSVVKHSGNTYLDRALNDYQNLVGNNPKFTVFTSEDLVISAESMNDPELDKWAKWYRSLYRL